MPIVSKDEGALQDQPGLPHPVDGQHHLPLPASPQWAATRPTTTTTTLSMVNVTRSRPSYFTAKLVKNTGSLVSLFLRVLNKNTTEGF